MWESRLDLEQKKKKNSSRKLGEIQIDYEV